MSVAKYVLCNPSKNGSSHYKEVRNRITLHFTIYMSNQGRIQDFWKGCSDVLKYPHENDIFWSQSGPLDLPPRILILPVYANASNWQYSFVATFSSLNFAAPDKCSNVVLFLIV